MANVGTAHHLVCDRHGHLLLLWRPPQQTREPARLGGYTCEKAIRCADLTGQPTHEPAEPQSPSNPRVGLVELNPRSARVRLASFSRSILLKARPAAAISDVETCSLRRIFSSSPLSVSDCSLLNARF